MLVRGRRRTLLSGAVIFLVLAYGLYAIVGGAASQPPDVFSGRRTGALRSLVDKITGTAWGEARPLTDKVGRLGKEESSLETEESLATSSAALATSPSSESISRPTEQAGEDEEEEGDAYDKYDKDFKENVQMGPDISHLLTEEQHNASIANQKIEHIELFSNLTTDGRWWMVDFINHGSYNPNIMPHPDKDDVYIMTAQRDKQYDSDTTFNVELVCEAHFRHNKLKCIEPPLILPIAATVSDLCVGDIVDFNTQIGPHDGRMFYGPDAPYVVYGSQSKFNCLGQWIQDLRRLIPFVSSAAANRNSTPFYFPTNLQRPPPYGEIEKNWYPFWSFTGDMYTHFDLSPRVFARQHADGSVGPDLAPLAARADAQCMAALMPPLRDNGLEWVHQGTNSLSLTLCKRADAACAATAANTFILTLFQTKTFYYHGNYEPYAMLFRSTPPFALYGVSSKPFWYMGRGHAGENWTQSSWKPKDQSEMVFTTSMSWQGRGQRYHGFLDDSVLIGFGIEDNHAGGLDVVAGELLRGLALCEDVGEEA